MVSENAKEASSTTSSVLRMSWHAHTVLVGQVLGIFIFLLPIFGYSVWLEWQHGLAQQAEDIVMRANSLAARQTTLTASTRSLLISMSLTPDVRSGNAQTIYSYFKKVGQIQQDYDGFAFFNMQGETVAMVYHGEEYRVEPETIRERVYFQEALVSQGFNVSVPMLVNNYFVLPMTLPVTNDEGKRVGMLTALLSLSQQSDVVQHVTNNATYSVNFFDAASNIVLAIGDINNHKVAVDALYARGLLEFLKENSYVYTEDNVLFPRTFEMMQQGSRFVGTVVSIKNADDAPYLYIVVLADQINFTQFINNRYAWQILLMGLLVILALWIATFIGRRYFTQGLELLANVAKRSRGGDLTARCGNISGCNEIQVLSASFDTMLDELESKTAILLSLSQTDSLTGLWNRRYVMEVGEQQCQVAWRYARSMAVVMADIDFFKKVNDTYGHAAGDTVLQHFAKTLASNLRAADILARFGGEEFIILLPDTNTDGAANLGERLRYAVESSSCRTQEGDTVKITASFGIAVYTPNVSNAPTLAGLQALADTALYTSKANGRNRVTMV